MDLVTGDPVKIEAVAQSLGNIAVEISAAADEYERALRIVAPSWTSDQGAAYLEAAGRVVTAMRATAGAIVDAGNGMVTCGCMTATTRYILIHSIAVVVAKATMEWAIANALAGPTYGGSVAVWMTKTIVSFTILAAKIALKLAKLVQGAQLFATKFKEIGAAADELAVEEDEFAAHIRSHGRPQTYPGSTL